MTTFQSGQYVKILAHPNAEARKIIEVRAGEAKPLICLPSSAIESTQAAPEAYAEAEVREALPHEYSLKTMRQRAVDAAFKALQAFRQDVAQEKQFEAFVEVTKRYLADSRASEAARFLMSQTIEDANLHQKPWSVIATNFLLNPQVPADGYELLAVTLHRVTQQYTAPPRAVE